MIVTIPEGQQNYHLKAGDFARICAETTQHIFTFLAENGREASTSCKWFTMLWKDRFKEYFDTSEYTKLCAQRELNPQFLYRSGYKFERLIGQLLRDLCGDLDPHTDYSAEDYERLLETTFPDGQIPPKDRTLAGVEAACRNCFPIASMCLEKQSHRDFTMGLLPDRLLALARAIRGGELRLATAIGVSPGVFGKSTFFFLTTIVNLCLVAFYFPAQNYPEICCSTKSDSKAAVIYGACDSWPQRNASGTWEPKFETCSFSALCKKACHTPSYAQVAIAISVQLTILILCCWPNRTILRP